MEQIAGRTCPIAYRYGPAALAAANATRVETLYVVGGLYGNPFALAALLAMAAAETGPVTLCFNGDFNWFNLDDAGFRAINEAVLQHHAIKGNVEFEFAGDAADAGCGCAYPASVAQAVVERSNRIHARLKQSAARHPDIAGRIAALPLFARYAIGKLRVAVVHGDAHSLAGWQFDPAELDKPENLPGIVAAFAQAQVDLFASTHTCMPAMRRFVMGERIGMVANNGAAGMPNFRGMTAGLLTRIATTPAPQTRLYGSRMEGVWIDALPIAYDNAGWQAAFLANWPAGSDAHASYFDRIVQGPDYRVAQAAPT